MEDVVALLSDDALPPERLGALLQAARKRRGWKRRDAAVRARITTAQLRAYEHGDKPVPDEIVERLAECYGEDLTAHIPRRIPVQVTDGWVVTANDAESTASGDPEDVLRAYTQLLLRVRNAKPGEAISLRASDLAAVAAAVNGDPDEVETWIVQLLGCTRAEAADLRHQLLTRRVILPVASLAAGLALLVSANTSPTNTAPAPTPIEAASPTTTATALIADITPNLAEDAGLPAVETPAPTTVAPAPAPVAEAPASAPAPAPVAEDLPAPLTDATTPPPFVENPAPAEGDGTVGILPGEQPEYIIIGDAIHAPE